MSYNPNPRPGEQNFQLGFGVKFLKLKLKISHQKFP